MHNRTINPSALQINERRWYSIRLRPFVALFHGVFAVEMVAIAIHSHKEQQRDSARHSFWLSETLLRLICNDSSIALTQSDISILLPQQSSETTDVWDRYNRWKIDQHAIVHHSLIAGTKTYEILNSAQQIVIDTFNTNNYCKTTLK